LRKGGGRRAAVFFLDLNADRIDLWALALAAMPLGAGQGFLGSLRFPRKPKPKEKGRSFDRPFHF